MPPSSASPALPRRAAAALALVGVLTLWGGAVSAQEVPPSTVPDVLVPGSSTPTSVPPTSGPATTTTAPAAGDDGGLLSFDLDANEKVWVIVGGLVVVAVLLAVLTVVYWRHTKPDRPKRDRRIDRDERHEQRRRRKSKDPFAGADDREDAESAGPLDLDELLGSPDPGRSVFAPPDQPQDPPG